MAECAVCAQEPEDKLLEEMQGVKDTLTRRQKREKKKRLEAKRKFRLRAAQLDKSEAPLHLPLALLNISTEQPAAVCRVQQVGAAAFLAILLRRHRLYQTLFGMLQPFVTL